MSARIQTQLAKKIYFIFSYIAQQLLHKYQKVISDNITSNMNDKEAGKYWNENAEVWTELARTGFDVYRDHYIFERKQLIQSNCPRMETTEYTLVVYSNPLK